jgi:GNAT superfamily N-acetyltransferase
LQIRRARGPELADCAALVGAGVRETFTWLKINYPEVDFIRASAGEEVYVAVEEDLIVGVAALYRRDSFVHFLFVRSGFQSRGIGAALLARIESIADGPISLKVQTLNHRGRAFYEREGLTATEEGRDKDGSGWIRMQRLPSAALS